MRWRGERESENVEDRRDEGGGFGFPFPAAASAFRAAAVGRAAVASALSAFSSFSV